jgi:hypothetical protein
MRETELNTIFSIIPDPEKNALDIADRKVREEVLRITRIFEINNKQKLEAKGLELKILHDFKLSYQHLEN